MISSRLFYSSLFLSGFACTDNNSSQDPVLYTDCILDTPSGEIPTDLYTVQSPSSSSEYGDFSKVMIVYGITLVAKADVSDDFLNAVGQTIIEMFPANSAQPEQQQEIIKNMYQYKALVPVFAGGEAGFNPDDIDSIPGDHSICDIIMSDIDGGQVMEVVEHLLHIISNVGLHYSHTDEWGLSNQSTLYTSMQHAQDLGIYNTTDYLSIDEERVLQRILLQEYAYWIISSHWDIQTEYGPNDGFEWTATTPQALETQLSRAHQLITSTISATMTAPSLETLSILEGYEGASQN